jgi:ribonuclease-3
VKARRRRDPAALAQRLGHEFRDSSLLERALTHPSISSGRDATYERLEFLGDRVLGLAVAHMLVEAFPQANEGELSPRLNLLVRRETCAEIAEALDIGRDIRMSEGEALSGGRRKAAILADVIEALIGAVFLDAGFEAAAAVVDRHWRARMMRPAVRLRDAKTELQEWAHARGLASPAYRELGRSGPDHDPQFSVAVDVDGYAASEGRGRSKRLAEQSAAQAFLEREKVWDTRHGAGTH